MQSAHLSDRIDTGTEEKMVCISKDNAGVEFVLEPFEANSLDRSLRSNRHKNRRLYYRTPG